MAKKTKGNKKSEFGRIRLPKGKTANDRAKENVVYPCADEGLSVCQNCRGTFTQDKLAEITHGFWERVSPGEIMPSGECPNCGALCHPVAAPAEPIRVSITVEGGVIQDVSVPKGAIVTVSDYDIEGVDADRISKDAHGEECCVTTWGEK